MPMAYIKPEIIINTGGVNLRTKRMTGSCRNTHIKAFTTNTMLTAASGIPYSRAYRTCRKTRHNSTP